MRTSRTKKKQKGWKEKDEGKEKRKRWGKKYLMR